MKDKINEKFLEQFTVNNLNELLPVNYHFLDSIISLPSKVKNEISLFHNNKNYYCGISVKPISTCIDYNLFNDGNRTK